MSTGFQGATEEFVAAGGIDWRVGVAGPAAGRTVVLLHGFPEYWRTWSAQFLPLTAAGFRVVAPDLPGYGGTEEPPSYEIKDLGELVAELCRVVDPRGVDLVGHDWGGMIAQVAAADHPEAIQRLGVACAPHPATFSGALRDPLQILRSWYVGLFQVPKVEGVLSEGTRLEKVIPGAVSEIEDSTQLARALAYYRANLQPWGLKGSRTGRITQPGLVIHAEKDRHIGARLMEATAEMFDDLRAFERIDSGHFVQRERADLFNDILLRFLRG
jgi:epoxide hydrolase 4